MTVTMVFVVKFDPLDFARFILTDIDVTVVLYKFDFSYLHKFFVIDISHEGLRYEREEPGPCIRQEYCKSGDQVK